MRWNSSTTTQEKCATATSASIPSTVVPPVHSRCSSSSLSSTITYRHHHHRHNVSPSFATLLLVLVAALLLCRDAHVLFAEARTATRTPDELVCLPMVVDYEGYAVLGGVIAGVIAVVIYVCVVRREGRKDEKRRRRLEAEGYRAGDEDTVYENHEAHDRHAAADDLEERHQHANFGAGGSDTALGGSNSNRGPQRSSGGGIALDAAGSLDDATDPAVREALRHRVADDVPEPPPRR
ncbi:membrane-associated protein, putative [Bodo saltans]|uniref:Membrane-associated protein, putative n=1 Tax=Bodo saltans TaxID=75058 RepID=A0A0S4INU9_BODSA|nr:membrane-associated protein, putative [Bodo saltans]|eukprot:CUE68061.1 membrane-associated protein, putative [Bodo saltans]